MKRIMMKLKKALPLLTLLFVGGLLLSPVNVYAGSPQELACDGAGGTWNGDECVNPSDQGGDLLVIITNIINTLLFVIGIVAVIMIIIGGFRYVVAQGDTGQLAAAKNTILYSVIGLVVAIAAFAIVNFILGRF